MLVLVVVTGHKTELFAEFYP